MTTIKLIVTGASARAEVAGLLTSGMVGIPVTISYDSAWDGLKKTLVCRGGSIARTILNVDGMATVPHECMIANATLQIGVEGRNADGTLVIPTVWARCGLICSGANAEADPSTDPTLPVWAQIQRAVGNLDDLNTEAKGNLVAAVNEAMEKGGGIGIDTSLTVSGKAADAAVVGEKFRELSEEIANMPGGGSGLTAAQIDLLEDAFEHIQWADDAGPQYAAQLISSLRGGESGGEEPEEPDTTKTLTGISAEYTGGNVAVGTDLTSLSGITVTAHYSDGSTVTVTGYSLSGTIAEGDNTITVTYMGQTTTITVTGVAQSADGRTLLHNWVLNDQSDSGIDTVGGAEMTSYYAVKGSDGWSVDDSWKAMYAANVCAPNRTIEWDVTTQGAEIDHGWCFVFGSDKYKGDHCIAYKDGVWGWEDATGYIIDLEIPELVGINAFDGKTVAFCINTEGYISLYVDGVYISTSPWTVSCTNSVIGRNATAFYTISASACRVYEGVL